jgi:hypothetical protein
VLSFSIPPLAVFNDQGKEFERFPSGQHALDIYLDQAATAAVGAPARVL